ncbi:MAG: hypothetical protein HRU12_08350 [Phaeodactylibacter sp.]|nr:hypothetical protein [Phaeodactylibacter sp.]
MRDFQKALEEFNGVVKGAVKANKKLLRSVDGAIKELPREAQRDVKLLIREIQANEGRMNIEKINAVCRKHDKTYQPAKNMKPEGMGMDKEPDDDLT